MVCLSEPIDQGLISIPLRHGCGAVNERTSRQWKHQIGFCKGLYHLGVFMSLSICHRYSSPISRRGPAKKTRSRLQDWRDLLPALRATRGPLAQQDVARREPCLV